MNLRPCAFPVIIARCPTRCPIFRHIIHWTDKSRSERVFASGKHPCKITGCGNPASDACARLDAAKSRDCSDARGQYNSDQRQ